MPAAPPPPDHVFSGRVLTPDGLLPRRVTVRGGRITAVESIPDRTTTSTGDAGAGELVELVELAGDEVLLPGLVDSHVHVNEPGRTSWEGFATATRAAAAGGVTTICDMPLNSIPATTSVEALATKRAAAAGQVAVDTAFWGGAVPDSLGHLADLHAAGVVGFKCFLADSGVAEFPPLTADQLRVAAAEVAAFDGLLIVHAEDPEVLARHQVEHTTRYDEFLGSRPPEAEVRAIETVVAAARETGCRLHLVHLSAAEALPTIAAARADGVRLTVETCPHYLTLAAEDVPDRRTPYKCCPPIRERANADALWAALADGTIDCVVSDHSPCTADLKLLDEGDFGAAWGGIASLQLGLPLVWTYGRRRGLTLEQVVPWLSRRPAELVGLAGRGVVEVGAVGDLVVFAPDQTWTVRAAELEHRNPVTPYEGRTLDGVVRATYRRGERVTPGGQPRGELLARA